MDSGWSWQTWSQTARYCPIRYCWKLWYGVYGCYFSWPFRLYQYRVKRYVRLFWVRFLLLGRIKKEHMFSCCNKASRRFFKRVTSFQSSIYYRAPPERRMTVQVLKIYFSGYNQTCSPNKCCTCCKRLGQLQSYYVCHCVLDYWPRRSLYKRRDFHNGFGVQHRS